MQTADIIATSAAVISLCSLFATIYTLFIQRKHDRKSVQPIPPIVIGDYENCIFVAIENAGVGPYIIRELIVENVYSKISRSSVIEQLPQISKGFYWTTFIEKLEQRAIPSQDRLVLVQLDEPKIDEGFSQIRQQMRVALGNLKIIVNGVDIYGNKMPECSRALDYFHREFFGYINSPKKLGPS